MKKNILLPTIALLSTTFLFSCNSETKKEITYDEANTLYKSLMEKADETFKNLKTMSTDSNITLKNQTISKHVDIDKTSNSLYYYSKTNIIVSKDSYKQSSVIEVLILKVDTETTYKCYTKVDNLLSTDTYTEEALSNLINDHIDDYYTISTSSDFPDKDNVPGSEKFYNYNNGGLMFENVTEESSSTIKYDKNGILIYICTTSGSDKVEYKCTYNNKLTKKAELTV